MDMNALQISCVFLGGGLGACLRWLFGLWSAGLHPSFNFGVTFANLSGCLAIGLAAGYMERHGAWSEATRLFVVTGILGGFTTFSAFSLEATVLLRSSPPHGILYLCGKVVLCVLLTYGGYSLLAK